FAVEGRTALARKEWAEALKLADGLEAYDPIEAARVKSMAYRGEKKHQEALGVYKKGLELARDPGVPSHLDLRLEYIGYTFSDLPSELQPDLAELVGLADDAIKLARDPIDRRKQANAQAWAAVARGFAAISPKTSVEQKKAYMVQAKGCFEKAFALAQDHPE